MSSLSLGAVTSNDRQQAMTGPTQYWQNLKLFSDLRPLHPATEEARNSSEKVKSVSGTTRSLSGMSVVLDLEPKNHQVNRKQN